MYKQLYVWRVATSSLLCPRITWKRDTDLGILWITKDSAVINSLSTPVYFKASVPTYAYITEAHVAIILCFTFEIVPTHILSLYPSIHIIHLDTYISDTVEHLHPSKMQLL